MRTLSVNFLGVSDGSVSLRHQLVHCYSISETSVSFRYQLWHLCDILSGLVSLRYQLLHRYNVSNWLVLFTYQWDVTNVATYMRPKLDVATTSNVGWESLFHVKINSCINHSSRGICLFFNIYRFLLKEVFSSISFFFESLNKSVLQCSYWSAWWGKRKSFGSCSAWAKQMNSLDGRFLLVGLELWGRSV